jgi:hypothetical protein
MVAPNAKIFELTKVRLRDVKTYGHKTGFVVEVHVLNDNSKRFVIIWDGDENAHHKFYRVTDLVAVESIGQEINRALAYKNRKALRNKEVKQQKNDAIKEFENSLSNDEALERQISNSLQASKLAPCTSVREKRTQKEDINLDARNYQVYCQSE